MTCTCCGCDAVADTRSASSRARAGTGARSSLGTLDTHTPHSSDSTTDTHISTYMCMCMRMCTCMRMCMFMLFHVMLLYVLAARAALCLALSLSGSAVCTLLRAWCFPVPLRHAACTCTRSSALWGDTTVASPVALSVRSAQVHPWAHGGFPLALLSCGIL